MSKNLGYGNLVTRPKKLAFYGVPNKGYPPETSRLRDC